MEISWKEMKLMNWKKYANVSSDGDLLKGDEIDELEEVCQRFMFLCCLRFELILLSYFDLLEDNDELGFFHLRFSLLFRNLEGLYNG